VGKILRPFSRQVSPDLPLDVSAGLIRNDMNGPGSSTMDQKWSRYKGRLALSGFRTRDSSNQAAADLRLRPRGHRDRQMHLHRKFNYAVIHLNT
jgi:hypothetical protein